MLSVGAGECIFLHKLRTAVRSLVSDLLDVTTDSERAILNPFPSTEAATKLNVNNRTGATAQLFAWHVIRNDGVGGSNPSCGTSTYQFGLLQTEPG